ncbi:response regulator [Herbaspirillum sp. SJZ099]|uniref:response regulator n=1 Tax=Herbaspirillum sp. SJZ099 TaxID=2572916 RepID=UPI0011A8A58D|nr:response regulator [Herbaspirillum sp. SJZ099]TWC71433.1 Hpt domain-containing protein [Herbaspirillum sp. SJZ099]
MSEKGPWILVVDDSATSRMVIEKQLRKFGCRVTGAEDGRSALAAIQAQRYGLVLLDCYMPDMNGYEVARRVREAEEGDPDAGYTPLIGISAEADAAHVQLCLDSGMDGILGKPLPIGEFKKMLSLWCDYDVDEPVASAPVDVQSVDLDALFRTTSLQDLAAMRTAHAASDVAAVQRLAHRMKGAALTMQRGEIVTTLERIEDATRNGAAGFAAIVGLMAQLEVPLGA